MLFCLSASTIDDDVRDVDVVYVDDIRDDADIEAGAKAAGSQSNSDGEANVGTTSSLEDEVGSTSSRGMNFSTERDSVDNRLGRDYYERPSDNSSDDDDGADENNRAPQYRHSVTTNWSSSDEETEKYRERNSLFRRSETSSPDYFPPARGDLIRFYEFHVKVQNHLIVFWC